MLQHYLPFWLANLVDRMWPAILTIVAVLLPLSRILPPLYIFRIRSRVFRWYRQLREVEAAIGRRPNAELLRELEAIEKRVEQVTVPLSYAEELYALRTHIHMVAERADRPGAGDRRRRAAPMTRPRVLIIGCGFGGIEAVRALSKADVEITLVDRTNHHLFQPLLYQVATAGLSAPAVSAPIRHVLQRQMKRGNLTILKAEVQAIDVAGKSVIVDGGERIAWDHLIVAAGATHSYFGHDEWAAHAPGLKTLADAFDIRAPRHRRVRAGRAGTATRRAATPG